MKKLFTLLFLLPVLAGAQTYPRIGYLGGPITNVIGANTIGGDPEPPAENTPAAITGFQAEDNGWQMGVYLAALGTNGTFDLNWTTNGTADGTQLSFSLTSPGFDTAGNATNYTRIVRGTKQVRFPYPSESYADTTPAGDGVRINIALTEKIYLGDTAISGTAPASLYSQGGTNSLALSSPLAVTNNSAATYPKPVANWAWRGFRVYSTGEDMPLEVFAGSHFATNGRPVACVKFVVRDSTGAYFTNTVSTLVKSTNSADAIQGPIYRAVFDTSTMAAGIVECNAIVYPWYGTNYLSTFDEAAQEPTTLFTTLKNAVKYNRVRAIVDAVSGSDTTGRAADETYWATNTSPPAFLTIGRAILHIANTNSANYARGAQPGGGIVYLKTNAAHTYLGSSLTISSNSLAEVVIMPEPGATARSASITNYAADNRGQNDGDIVRFYRVNITGGSGTLLSQCKQVWFEDCALSWSGAGGAALIQQTTTAGGTWVVTGCGVTNFTQGFAPYTSQNCAPSLVRGNWIGPEVLAVRVTSTLFNSRTDDATNSMTITESVEGMLQPRGMPYVLAFNRFGNLRGVNLVLGSHYGTTNGALVVNNLFEYTGTNNATEAFKLPTTPTLNFTNVITAENTIVGSRTFAWYNDEGTNAWWRVGCIIDRTIADKFGFKTDLHNEPAPSGNRIGNWETMWGVGWEGNASLSSLDIGYTAAFQSEFVGVNSFQMEGGNDSSWVEFVSRGTNGVTGDYRLLNTSPILTLITNANFAYPWDLAGYARTNTSPPGAYVEVVTP